MGEWKAKQERARVPVCWVCDRKLYAGGKTYALFVDPVGNTHPVHNACEGEAVKDGLERVDHGVRP